MKLKDIPEKAGLSGVIELKKADGTIQKLYINGTKPQLGDNPNGNTSTSDERTKHNR